jgi:hypothetical protein
MPLSAPLVVLGQLTSASFAGGLNLYLTVALIGIASRLSLLPVLPPGLKGLENELVIGSALLLYLIEFVVDKVPHADSIWDAMHTVVRPLGTALLAALALDAAATHWQIAAGILAGTIALAAHGTKAGIRIVLNRSPSKLRNTAISTLEDVCAAALAVLALRYPVAALAVGGTAVLILALLGPGFWRVSALAVRAFAARWRAFFGAPGWRSLAEVPVGLRSLIEPPPPGRSEPRALRAAVKGMPGVGAYRNGWLIFTWDRTCFVYRSIAGTRCLTMPPLLQHSVQRGLWTDVVEFNTNGNQRCTLFLLKDGPAPEVAVSDLLSATAA